MSITDIIWFGLKDWKTTMLVFYRGPPSISLDLVDEDEVYIEQLVGFLRVGKEENLPGERGFRLGFCLAPTQGAARTRDGVGSIGAGGFGFGGWPRQGGSCETTGNSDRTGFSLSTDTESVLEPTWRRKNFEERFRTK